METGTANKIDEVIEKVKKKVYDKDVAKSPEEIIENIS